MRGRETGGRKRAAGLAGALLALLVLDAPAVELGGLYPTSQVARPVDVTNAVAAEAQARAAGDLVAMTNWQAVVYSLTNGAALGATALQPSWAATGHVATAGYAESAEHAAGADWAAEATYATDAGFATTAIMATTADFADFATTATEAVSAQSLTPDMPDAIALAAATAHTNSPAAHPDIRAAIDAIPLPPTNAVAGWFVWDPGSNVFWRVSATNMRFYVWP